MSRLSRIARACTALATALALAGCFDLELTLKLNSDGSGQLSTRAILAKEFVQMGAHGAPPESKLLGNGTRVRRKSEVRNGQLVQEESTEFDRLEQVRGIEGGQIEVTRLSSSIGERNRVRWVLRNTKRDTEAPSPDSSAVEGILKGHLLIMEIDVPCTVTSAKDVKLNYSTVAPFVSRDIFSGSKVRWVVPLSALFNMPNGKVTFELECWSFSGIAPGHTPN